jgi:N-methylhydantoinase A
VKGHRPAFFPESDGYVETPVYDRYLLRPGMSLVGPAIIEERESTLVVGPGGVATVDEFLNVLVEMPS